MLTSKGELKFHEHMRTKKTGRTKKTERKVVKFTDFWGGLPETKKKLSAKTNVLYETYGTKKDAQRTGHYTT